jgi:GTP cyclohydrolase I
MEIKPPMAEINQYKVTWKEIYSRMDKLPIGRIYGIPRGGSILAGISRRGVDRIEDADFLLDDIVDSGRTRIRFREEVKKPFLALFDKQKEAKIKNKWVIFPWEGNLEIDIQETIVRLIEQIGEDPRREGLERTPARVAKSFSELYRGYSEDPKKLLVTFSEGSCDEMVILRKTEFFSTCEHHILPFYGEISVGYVPDRRVIGISKIARLIDVFSRRLQIQERLTAQIADAIQEGLKPKGVMVVCQAKHLCMMARGVNKRDGEMITSAIRGVFRSKMAAREEFLKLTS